MYGMDVQGQISASYTKPFNHDHGEPHILLQLPLFKSNIAGFAAKTWKTLYYADVSRWNLVRSLHVYDALMENRSCHSIDYCEFCLLIQASYLQIPK